jgi:hypothetical protein
VFAFLVLFHAPDFDFPDSRPQFPVFPVVFYFIGVDIQIDFFVIVHRPLRTGFTRSRARDHIVPMIEVTHEAAQKGNRFPYDRRGVKRPCTVPCRDYLRAAGFVANT